MRRARPVECHAPKRVPKRRSSSARKPASSRCMISAARAASSDHVTHARPPPGKAGAVPGKGRIANGPAGRKCCVARPPCGSSCATVVMMPVCSCRQPTVLMPASRGSPIRDRRPPPTMRARNSLPSRAALRRLRRKNPRYDRRPEIDAGVARAAASKAALRSASRSPRKRPRRPRAGCVAQHRQADGRFERGVGDVDIGDRLRLIGDLGPDAQRGQQTD